MKALTVNKALRLLAAALFLSLNIAAQLPNLTLQPAKPIIFAVVYDGSTIEPIAYIEKGELMRAESGGDTRDSLIAFSNTYYKPKSTYTLVFGGAADGKVQINRTYSPGDCSGNSTDVSTKPKKSVLKGSVMALATNADIRLTSEGVRRRPTPAERAEIEALVRAEFRKQKGSAKIMKLRNHNLTAVDVDRDGQMEFIGSYWIAPEDNERRLLFFIAEKSGTGKYSLVLSDFQRYTPENIMSEDPKDLDGGVYHELLLDVFDVNGDGVSEIFTTTQAFEGRNFHVYSREGDKWVKNFETYNYRCVY